MYKKVETVRYDLRIVLSSAAIGGAYFCSNMPEKTTDSYREAIRYPASPSENNHYKEMTIPKLVRVLVLTQRAEEAEKCGKIPSESEFTRAHQALQFLTPATDASHYIQKSDLRNTNSCLLQAEQTCLLDRQPCYCIIYNYMQGRYNGATGNYNFALQYYDEILTGIRQKMRSIIYLQVVYAKTNLLIEMDNKVEAAYLCEEVSTIIDSVVAPSYTHRVDSPQVSYRENRVRVENKVGFNRIFISGISIEVIILGIMIYLVIHILKQNKKIAESKIYMEQPRLNAENAVQTKSLFLSSMDHEVRTPLSTLSSSSSPLTEQALDAETHRQCGNITQQNSDLLLKLVNDVADLPNLEIGNIKFNFTYCDTTVICNNIVNTVDKVRQTQAELHFNISLTSLKLYTDNSRLQQLLINLLISTTKFILRGSIAPEVRQESEEFTLLSVTDTGYGIPLERQGSIFDRFEKLDEGAQEAGPGLPIYQLIIERIGGNVWINPAYTTGCRLYFTHPVNPTREGKEMQS